MQWSLMELVFLGANAVSAAEDLAGTEVLGVDVSQITPLVVTDELHHDRADVTGCCHL